MANNKNFKTLIVLALIVLALFFFLNQEDSYIQSIVDEGSTDTAVPEIASTLGITSPVPPAPQITENTGGGFE